MAATGTRRDTGVRDRLVDAGASLMREKGYFATTIEDILSRTGASKGNFFHYFRSKEELGYAVIDAFRLECRRRFRRIIEDEALSPMSRLYRYLDDQVDCFRKDGNLCGCPCGMLAMELSGRHEGFRERLQEVFDEIGGAFQKLYEAAKAAGELHEEVNSRGLAMFTVASYQGALLLTKTAQDAEVMASILGHLREYLDSLRQG